MSDAQPISADIVNDSGKALMSIKGLSRQGDKVVIRGCFWVNGTRICIWSPTSFDTVKF